MSEMFGSNPEHQEIRKIEKENKIGKQCSKNSGKN